MLQRLASRTAHSDNICFCQSAIQWKARNLQAQQRGQTAPSYTTNTVLVLTRAILQVRQYGTCKCCNPCCSVDSPRLHSIKLYVFLLDNATGKRTCRRSSEGSSAIQITNTAPLLRLLVRRRGLHTLQTALQRGSNSTRLRKENTSAAQQCNGSEGPAGASKQGQQRQQRGAPAARPPIPSRVAQGLHAPRAATSTHLKTLV